MFVFGSELQFWVSGKPIPVDDQEYIWIPELLAKLECPINNIHTLPTLRDPNALHYIVSGMKDVLGENILSGILMLGMLP